MKLAVPVLLVVVEAGDTVPHTSPAVAGDSTTKLIGSPEIGVGVVLESNAVAV